MLFLISVTFSFGQCAKRCLVVSMSFPQHGQIPSLVYCPDLHTQWLEMGITEWGYRRKEGRVRTTLVWHLWLEQPPPLRPGDESSHHCPPMSSRQVQVDSVAPQHMRGFVILWPYWYPIPIVNPRSWRISRSGGDSRCVLSYHPFDGPITSVLSRETDV